MPDAAKGPRVWLYARSSYFFFFLCLLFSSGCHRCLRDSQRLDLGRRRSAGRGERHRDLHAELVPFALASLLSADFEMASVTVPLPPDTLALSLPTVTPPPVALTCTLPASGKPSDRTMSLPLTFALAIEKALLGGDRGRRCRSRSLVVVVLAFFSGSFCRRPIPTTFSSQSLPHQRGPCQ